MVVGFVVRRPFQGTEGCGIRAVFILIGEGCGLIACAEPAVYHCHNHCSRRVHYAKEGQTWLGPWGYVVTLHPRHGQPPRVTGDQEHDIHTYIHPMHHTPHAHTKETHDYDYDDDYWKERHP